MKFAGAAVVLLIVAIGVIAMPHEAQAVNENFTNVPQFIRDEMYTARGPTQPYNGFGQSFGGGGSNNQCGKFNPLYNHAQFIWLSRNGNNSEQIFTIDSNTNTVNLWFNNLSAHCDSLINSSGTITNQILKKTRTQVGGVGVSPGFTVTWSSANKVVNLDYNTSYFYNDRYIHGPSTPNMPANQPFSVSGFDNLALRPEPYEITVAVGVRAVHEYNNGSTYWRCVVGAGQATSLSDSNCPPQDLELKFKVYIRPPVDAICYVSGSGTNVPDTMIAGRQYEVTVLLANTGATMWLDGALGYYHRLGSGSDNFNGTPNIDPRTTRDNTHWQASQPPPLPTGPLRLKLANYPVPANQGLSSLVQATFTVTAPSTGGTHPFWWQMVQEVYSGGNFVSGQWFGSGCKKNIEVEVPKNLPFMRVSGGDVYAGALFAGQNFNCTSYPGLTRAQNAHIGTNGRWNYPSAVGEETETRWGASSSQYAVFASKLIGNDGVDGNNNFLGHDAYIRSTTDGSTATFEKDLLFANQGLTPARTQGSFYSGGNEGMPCFDITRLEALNATTPSNLSSFANDATVPSLVRVTSLTANTTTVAAGQRKVIFVDNPAGVTISGNISYAATANLSQTPFLMIISSGPIYIPKSVNRIDAHLVAFPDYASNGTLPSRSGIIDTCSDALSGQQGVWPVGANRLTISSCNTSQLEVNGSLVAKQVLWKRTRGSLFGSDRTADSVCSFSDGVTNEASFQTRLRQCAAEHVNFSPEAYFTNPLNGVPPSSTIGNVPLSTTDLPPTF